MSDSDTPFDELPELTLSLRSFGSRRGGVSSGGDPSAQSEQDRFFAPLLDARRRAVSATSVREVISAFDARRLVAAMDAMIRALALARFEARPPARRAFEARLFEIVEPLRDSLQRLRDSGENVLSANGGPEHASRWTVWVDTLRSAFRAADAVWAPLGAVLRESPLPATPPRRFGRSPMLLFAIVSSLSSALGALAAGPTVARGQNVTVGVTGVPAESLLARGFDVVERRASDVLLVANPSDRARLASLGWSTFEMPRPPWARAAADAPKVFRPFDDQDRGIRHYLDSLASTSSLVHVDSIGATYEGRPILAVKIGPADESPARPNVIFMATYHAREWAATEMALRLIRYLAVPPTPRADSLVRNRDVWVIPVSNPDGYQMTFAGDRLWRKNRRPVGSSIGVDLNRNHSERWGYDNSGSSPDPTSEVYRGPAAASELETQAIERFHLRYPPVTSVSYHTYSALLLFPPGFADGVLPGDLPIFRALVGTEARPAVVDHLPGPERPYYRPVSGWNLYPTNGEYTDWAYARVGTLAVTPEMTTGYENGFYYGFEFPDDEAKLQTLFLDNLPFALDMLESARNPLAARPQATGLATEPVVLESVTPIVRAIVPVASAPVITAGASLSLHLDTLGHGTFQRRWSSDSIARFPRLSVRAGTVEAGFTVLAVGGAEATDTGWVATGMTPREPGVAGRFQWNGVTGYVRSPVVKVPQTSDTVSVLFWTRYNGNGFSSTPHGEIRMSIDDGADWTRVGAVAGSAQQSYPERVVVVGVRGRSLRFEFSSPDRLPWWLDEITIVAHSAPTLVSEGVALRPSANPVRTDVVYFNWPFGITGGELAVYDFAGHRAWHSTVAGGTETVTWDLGRSGLANGVYVVIASAGGSTRRFKLFVLRPGGGAG